MNPKNKTMEGALAESPLPAEALAIIQDGAPKPLASSPKMPMAEAPSVASAIEQPTPVKTKTAKSVVNKERSVELATSVAVTFRLPLELSQTLIKASVERKLEKRWPHTQQNIVADALQNWLQKNGYLPEKS